MRKVVQVAGCVRSGTTVTGLILGNREGAHSLGELMHLFKPYRPEHFEKIGALWAEPRWRHVLGASPHNIYSRYFESFPECSLLIDSSKDPFWFEELSKKASVQVQQIATYKNPSEQQYSFQKRGLNNWGKVYVNYYRRLFSIFPEVKTIGIKLFLESHNAQRAVTDHLGLAFKPRMLEYWRNKHPNFFGSESVRTQSIRQDTATLGAEALSSDVAEWPDKVIRVYQELRRREISCGRKATECNDRKLCYNPLVLALYRLKDYDLYRLRHSWSEIRN